MAKVFSYTVPFTGDIVNAFCLLQKGFTDQFVYYRKDRPVRFMGLGRCIAYASLTGLEYELQGPSHHAPIFFSFNRFDSYNPKPADGLFEAFPKLRFMLPELVLIEDETGVYLQINSLGPVYKGRVERFLRLTQEAQPRKREAIGFELEPDSREMWFAMMDEAKQAISAGSVNKIVLSRRKKLVADHPFSSKDVLINLLDGPSTGVVLLYRYADVFFCGCTPELLVRKKGALVESMALAGTASRGAMPAEDEAFAKALLNDPKNRLEHDYVACFIRDAFNRICYNVDVPFEPRILKLTHVQHLYTPAKACILEGVDLYTLAQALHPTPAVSGAPVGEARMLLRSIEPYNRGFYAGACGYVDGNGDGEFSVALRTGVFDGEIGYVYGGCGIVADSDAQAEYEEIDLKLRTILTGFGCA